jgi:hypothetical protein
MVFKVSFKETEKSPSKVTQKVGKTTTVILKGVVELPAFWKHLPEEIIKWIEGRQKVEGYENLADNTLIIYSTGVSKCNPDDKYDSLLGERLAEARAKESIYKFFYQLSYKLFEYYTTIAFGSMGVIDTGSDGSLERTAFKYEQLYNREKNHQIELLKNRNNG